MKDMSGNAIYNLTEEIFEFESGKVGSGVSKETKDYVVPMFRTAIAFDTMNGVYSPEKITEMLGTMRNGSEEEKNNVIADIRESISRMGGNEEYDNQMVMIRDIASASVHLKPMDNEIKTDTVNDIAACVTPQEECYDYIYDMMYAVTLPELAVDGFSLKDLENKNPEAIQTFTEKFNKDLAENTEIDFFSANGLHTDKVVEELTKHLCDSMYDMEILTENDMSYDDAAKATETVLRYVLDGTFVDVMDAVGKETDFVDYHSIHTLLGETTGEMLGTFADEVKDWHKAKEEKEIG